MSTNANSSPAKPPRGLHIALWIAQGLLAVAFGLTGLLKTTTPIAELMAKAPWVTPQLTWLVRFIGVSELLGALGLIVPAATRILPKLTVVAAVGLVLVMILAALFHISRGEIFPALPINAVLGGLAAFVAWGRWKQAAIPSRSDG